LLLLAVVAVRACLLALVLVGPRMVLVQEVCFKAINMQSFKVLHM
jgi:hypothetical protein